MQVEVPLAIFQVLCLFRRYGSLPINWTCDRTDLDRNLWFCIRSLGRRSVKMCRYNWSGEITEYDVIFKLVSLGIQLGGQRSLPRTIFGGYFGRGFQVGLQIDRSSMGSNRYKSESRYYKDIANRLAMFFNCILLIRLMAILPRWDTPDYK